MISISVIFSVNVQSQNSNITSTKDSSNNSLSHDALIFEKDTIHKKEVKNANFKKSKYIEKHATATNQKKHGNDTNPINTAPSKENLKSSFNPLTNMHIDQLNVKVRNQMQMNKNTGADLFEGICLVYAIQVIGDTGQTNYNKILNTWKDEAHFLALKKLKQNQILLCLNPYFDTELSEEIMNINHLNVMFKEEYYALINFESER